MKDQLPITEEYVEYSTAWLAKELGFNEPCREYYNDHEELETLTYFYAENGWFTNKLIQREGAYLPSDIKCAAPTQSLLQRWLRETHDIHIVVEPVSQKDNEVTFYGYRVREKPHYISKIGGTEDNFEEAAESALIEALRVVASRR